MKPALTTLTVLLFCSAYGQRNHVFVRNHPDNTLQSALLEIKWFSKEFIDHQGFYVYRREQHATRWERVTPTPVARLNALPSATLAADSELSFFTDLINQNSAGDLKEGMVMLNVLLKSFQSNPFASFLGIYYRDDEVEVGKVYQYRITLASAGEPEIGQSDLIKAGLYKEPEPVENFEVYQNGREVAFNWEQNEGRFYAVNIFHEDSSGTRSLLNARPIMLSMVPDSAGRLTYPRPMFRKRGLREANSYKFYIEGLDYFGSTTSLSDPIELSLEDVTPPPRPGSLRGRVDSMHVQLRWVQEAAPDLKEFVVYRSRRSDGPYEKVNGSVLSVTDTVYEETILVPGPYYYYVEAVDHSGNRSRSDLEFVEVQDVLPPAQPVGLVIEADTGKFTLKWRPNEESDLKGYLIFRTVDQNNSDHYVLLNAEPIETSYFEQRLPKNVKNKFFYRVVAIDTSYNRSEPSAFATSTLPDVVPPEKPFINEIRYSDEGIIIEWHQNAESDLAGYHIYRSDSSAFPDFQRLNVELLAGNVFRFTDRTAEPNREYLYRMVATDSSGNISPASAPVYAMKFEEELLTGSLSLRLKSQKRKKVNKLEWSELSAEVLRGYMVFRGAAEDSVRPISTMIVSSTSFTDRSVEGDACVYQVRAYTRSGQVIFSPTIEWTSK